MSTPDYTARIVPRCLLDVFTSSLTTSMPSDKATAP
jgi:hypothetical protein